MKIYRRIAYVLILICFCTIVAQDGTCAAIVQQALSAVDQDCALVGRNQACYGYVSLDATPREGAVDFSFSQEGDLVNVADIESLRLSALDTANDTWGIALMRLQASLPDTLPGQNVTFLVFGNVEIRNAVSAGATTIAATSNGNVNVRSAPSTNADVIGTLSRGAAITVNRRSDDSTWLHIQIPGSDALGWVLAELVSLSADASTLPVADATDETPAYTPMQAFYFNTGIAQTNCEEAPQDGILIQTPSGVGQISLRANDVDIQLGSTAYLQAQPSANMSVSVVEGEGQVTAAGKTVTIPAGMQVTIPMDANLQPAGEPSDAHPYDPALVQSLPVQLLPEQITIAPPAPEATETPGGGGGSAGPFSAQTIMDLGGVVVSGTVCTLDQPFEITFSQTEIITWVIQFVPTGAAQGTYSYSYSLPDVGETATGEGTYTVSDAAADGSRTLTFDGTQTNTFSGGSPTMNLHYELGLVPAASCGG